MHILWICKYYICKHLQRFLFDLQKWDTTHTLLHLYVNFFFLFWLTTRYILWCGFISTFSRDGHSYSLCFQYSVTTKKVGLNIFVHTLLALIFLWDTFLGEVKLLIDTTRLFFQNAVAIYFHTSISVLCISASKVFCHFNFSIVLGMKSLCHFSDY